MTLLHRYIRIYFEHVTPDTTVKKKAAKQYRQVADLRGHPHVLTIPAREPDALPPLLEPTAEQVMIARVELDQRKRRPGPTPAGPDPREALAKVQLPDEPVVPQAERLAGPDLELAQRRRERLVANRCRDAHARQEPIKITRGDVGWFLVACALAVGAVAVAAGFAAGIEKWPALWGAA